VPHARERELPNAWVIVCLAFFALAVSTGRRATIGPLVRRWGREFGWDRAVVSLTASFGFLAHGLVKPLAGRAAILVLRLAVREPVRLFVFAVAFGLVDFAAVPPATALCVGAATMSWAILEVPGRPGPASGHPPRVPPAVRAAAPVREPAG
jgi:hypothetical protein